MKDKTSVNQEKSQIDSVKKENRDVTSIKDGFSNKLWNRMQSEGFSNIERPTNRSKEEIEAKLKELGE